MSPAFGLDIGIDVMKVVALSKKGDKLFLNSAAFAPSPRPGILSESAIDLENVADTVMSLCKQASISLRSADISIPQSQVYSKIIEMPKLSDRELAAALAYEMDQYIPLPLDQVRIDWQVLSEFSQNDETKINVLIIAASHSLLEKYEKILSFAKIHSESIETEIVSVQRALAPKLSGPTPTMLLHLGSSSLDLSVVRAGMLEMIYTIGLGGLAICRGISVDLGKSPGDLDHLEFLYSLTQDVFASGQAKSLVPIMDSILGDIRKAILAYRNKYTQAIDKIILSGEYAHIPGIAPYLSEELSVEVSLANPWVAQSIENVPQELTLRAAGFTVVVGLSLRGVV